MRRERDLEDEEIDRRGAQRRADAYVLQESGS